MPPEPLSEFNPCEFSRYAQQQLQRHPEWSGWLEQQAGTPITPAAVAAWFSAAPKDEASLRPWLRQTRQQLLLWIMQRDCAGQADLSEVMLAMSALADASIDAALQVALQDSLERHGQALGESSGQVQELLVVAMGKLGGEELNVSSDIDLIFLYPEEGQTQGPRRISNQEFFVKVGRKLIQLLQEVDGDGFVFRVDMRLRPFGDSGPLACSLDALETYLTRHGRPWERYAWMKARLITGSTHAESLQQVVRPFVYRKYLDYGAMAAIRELHSQIRAQVHRKEWQDNIKLGPGGIREIEFTAQIQQLVRGGREPKLQLKSTRAALAQLGQLQLMAEDTVTELQAAYDFLRRLEHRIQYLDDAQTQLLPREAQDQQRVAHAMGLDDWPHLLRQLDQHRRNVDRHFAQAFGAPQGEGSHPLLPLWLNPQADAGQQERLQQLGYADPEGVMQRLQALRSGSRWQSLTEANQQRLDQLVPALLEICADEAEPDACLNRILNLLEHIARRESYLALLLEYPQTLRRVVKLYAASPWVSQYVSQHPILLDELLDARALYAEPDWPTLTQEWRQRLEPLGADTEASMDCLRHIKHSQTFRLVAQDLAERYSLERLSDHISALADSVVQLTLERCWQHMPNKHRAQPAFAVIGYGKLGGKELGYASDLDLIFLYDDPDDSAAERYARLAKKINVWLTTLTPAGLLYEVDLRLRPDGASGLLVSQVQAFLQYQLHQAWVWEHQALTRARFVAGDPAVGATFEAMRRQVLAQVRPLPALQQEILAMRQKMHLNKPEQAQGFDLKQDPGGMIDLEFCVQYLILAHAHAHPELLDNVGNIALLQRAAAAQLISAPVAAQAQHAYRSLRSAQHRARLAGHTDNKQPALLYQAERQAVLQLWQALLPERN